MMRMNNIKMQTVVDKKQLLATLRQNLAEHAGIVKEAINGYIEQAQRAVTARLEELRSRKVVTLQFHLTPPMDYSEVYRTTIKMLEWTTEDRITLSADEFRQMVEDKWDWSETFYAVSAPYSQQAQSKMSQP